MGLSAVVTERIASQNSNRFLHRYPIQLRPTVGNDKLHLSCPQMSPRIRFSSRCRIRSPGSAPVSSQSSVRGSFVTMRWSDLIRSSNLSRFGPSALLHLLAIVLWTGSRTSRMNRLVRCLPNGKSRMSNRRYHAAEFGGSKLASFEIGRKIRAVASNRNLLPSDNK